VEVASAALDPLALQVARRQRDLIGVGGDKTCPSVPSIDALASGKAPPKVSIIMKDMAIKTAK